MGFAAGDLERQTLSSGRTLGFSADCGGEGVHKGHGGDKRLAIELVQWRCQIDWLMVSNVAFSLNDV